MWTPLEDCLLEQFYESFLNDNFLSRIYSEVFRTGIFQEKLLFYSKHFCCAATSSEYLVFRSCYFFGAASFFRTLTSSQQLFFQNSFLFGAKLLPTNYSLRIDSSLGQLVFPKFFLLYLFGFSEQLLLRKTNLLTNSISVEEFLFRRTHFYKTSNFSEQLLFNKVLPQKEHFFRTATFPEVLLLEGAIFFCKTIERVSTFSVDLLSQSSFFLKRALREKCPNTKFLLVRIFPHSD